jgi:hypothetical protein
MEGGTLCRNQVMVLGGPPTFLRMTNLHGEKPVVVSTFASVILSMAMIVSGRKGIEHDESE